MLQEEQGPFGFYSEDQRGVSPTNAHTVENPLKLSRDVKRQHFPRQMSMEGN